MEERYKVLLESIYSKGSEVKVEAAVTYRDGRKGIVATSIKIRDVPQA
jgi:long-chain acyl-CoA synthetase